MDDDKKLEEAAVSILTRAVKLDTERRYTESMVCYQEGLQLLLDSYKGTPPGKKRDGMKKKIEEYMDRAEKLKNIVDKKKEEGNYCEEIFIEEDSTGHSYESVMGRFLGASVEFVDIEDPYIRTYNQFCNLVHFCELIVKKCKHLRRIKVLTGSENNQEQLNWFNTLQDNLKTHYNISLQYEFSATLHDRQIVLSNGWIIKIGRGLDIFKPPHVKLGLGTYDTYFRPCRATVVNIFHEKNIKRPK